MSCSSTFFDNAAIDPSASNPNDCTYADLIQQYFTDLCSDTPLLGLLNQYPAFNESVGTCSVPHSWYYQIGGFPSNPLHDSDIQGAAGNLLNYLGLSASVNTEVFVFTPYGESSCAGSDCFEPGVRVDYCAYHNWSGSLIYASMPDAAWAGCGAGAPSPNNDPWADAVINSASHEAAESLTDPTGGGWFYQDGFHEIGDECAYDFVGVESDGSNVRLGSGDNPYLIQSEWSNANGGCTLDLNGPPTLVSSNLYADSTTGTTASSPPSGFAVSFQEAGQTTAKGRFSGQCCASENVYVTPSTSVSYSSITTANEDWCFEVNCDAVQANITVPTSVTIYYYDLLLQSSSYAVSGGGNIPAPNITFLAAPSSASSTDHGQSTSFSMTTSPGSFWAIRGSNSTVPSQLLGGSNERWATMSDSWSISSADAVASVVTYYHQYSVTADYSILQGGGKTLNGTVGPAGPALSGTQIGEAYSVGLGSSPAMYWLDSGTEWKVPNLLGGSTSQERWETTQPTNGTVSQGTTVELSYHHQYYLTVDLFPVAGGSVTRSSGWNDAGSTIQIAASADSGWKFEGWMGTGNGSSSVTENSTSITFSGPIVENATFYPGLTIVVRGGGSVSFEAGTAVPTGVVQSGTAYTVYLPLGTTARLTENPSSFLNQFTGWTGGNNGAGSAIATTVDAPTTTVASFSYNYVNIVGIVTIAIAGLIIGAVLLRRRAHKGGSS